MKESKTVLHTKAVIDGVEQEVLIMPITRLDCIEDTADIIKSVDAGDCIPIMDRSDNGQMKKISVENLLPSGNEFAAADHTHTASDISGLPTSLPANGGNADTIGGAAVMTTAALGLHRMASGTAAPTSATCPPGCWYGQYE